MVEAFTLRMAGFLFEVRPRFEAVRRLCADYLVDGSAAAPDLVVEPTAADIECERAVGGSQTAWSDAYLETLAMYRAISEWLPLHGCLLIHGAAIAYDGSAYLFSAPSGTGKTTHVRLWREHLGSAATVVNGDKPLVRVLDRTDAPLAVPLVYGTPWCGKEGWQQNVSVPLRGISLVTRAGARAGGNAICRVEPAAVLERIVRQVYLPADTAAAGATLDLLDRLLSRVPVFELVCDMTEDAVTTSFEGLTGHAYPAGLA